MQVVAGWESPELNAVQCILCSVPVGPFVEVVREFLHGIGRYFAVTN